MSANWISVSDKLPDDDQTVLIVMDDGEVWTGYHEGDGWVYVSGDTMAAAVTHWMPLPEPPEMKDGLAARPYQGAATIGDKTQ